MEARLSFSRSVAKQTSTYTKILKWMQVNKGRCSRVSAPQLGRYIAYDLKMSAGICTKCIKKMVAIQMLYRYGTERSSTFVINYKHIDIPPEVLSAAPVEDRERRTNLFSSLKPGQYVDAVGCVVTPEKKKTEEPKKVTITENVPEEVHKEETKEEEVSSDASEENTVSAPVEIKATENGMSISITLNININK